MSLTNHYNLTYETPTSTGPGGAALDGNFAEINTRGGPCNWTATTDPIATSDSAHNFLKGSKWLNTTTNVLWFCTSDTPTAAIWAPVRTISPTAVKTSSYTASPNDFIPCNTTSAPFTVTLPAAPADKTIVCIKLVIQGGSNAVTVTCGGSDVFNSASGPTTAVLSLINQSLILQYAATPAIWYVMGDDLGAIVNSSGQIVCRIVPSENTLAGYTTSGWVPLLGEIFVVTDKYFIGAGDGTSNVATLVGKPRYIDADANLATDGSGNLTLTGSTFTWVGGVANIGGGTPSYPTAATFAHVMPSSDAYFYVESKTTSAAVFTLVAKNGNSQSMQWIVSALSGGTPEIDLASQGQIVLSIDLNWNMIIQAFLAINGATPDAVSPLTAGPGGWPTSASGIGSGGVWRNPANSNALTAVP